MQMLIRLAGSKTNTEPSFKARDVASRFHTQQNTSGKEKEKKKEKKRKKPRRIRGKGLKDVVMCHECRKKTRATSRKVC